MKTFKGLPDEKFLSKLNPLLSGLRERLYNETYTCDAEAGNLSEEWAQKLGLSTEVKGWGSALLMHIWELSEER